MSSSLPNRYWLSEQLPRTLAENPFLRSFSLIFEDIADSIRDPVVAFEHFLDADVAPTAFVRWMGEWLGVSIDGSLPEPRQRRVLEAAGKTLEWRGTKRALQGMLESLVGSPVEIFEHGGVFSEGRTPIYDPRVTIRIQRSGGLKEGELRRFIEAELLVGTELELIVGEETGVEGQGGSKEDGGTS
jgi:phage tail-like protein